MEPLQKRIAQRRADLALHDRQREIMAAELRGLEEAAEILAASPTSEVAPVAVFVPNNQGSAPTPVRTVNAGPPWEEALRILSTKTTQFNYQQLSDTMHALGHSPTEGAARAKAMAWRQAGRILTIDRGTFRIVGVGEPEPSPDDVS
jgi:hypothetical protein